MPAYIQVICIRQVLQDPVNILKNMHNAVNTESVKPFVAHLEILQSYSAQKTDMSIIFNGDAGPSAEFVRLFKVHGHKMTGRFMTNKFRRIESSQFSDNDREKDRTAF